MAGTFACPECETALVLGGLTPGRLVRCPGCGTRVEVPFLPRVDKARRRTRGRSRTSRRDRLLKVGLGLAAAIFGAILVARMVGDRGRRQSRAELEAILAESTRAERSGHLGRAVVDVEAALELARRLGPDFDADRDALRPRRADLVHREVAARLAESTEPTDPARASGTWDTLAARARVDPALADLAAPIAARRAAARLRWSEAERAAAGRAAAAGRPDEAMGLCERADRAVADLAPAEGLAAHEAAYDLAAGLVRSRGVVVEPPGGVFRSGTAARYAEALAGPFAEALRSRGFLPRRPKALWPRLWDDSAPFRLTTRVEERADDPRRITVDLTLARGGAAIWREFLEAPRTPDGGPATHAAAFAGLVALVRDRVGHMPAAPGGAPGT